MGLAFFAKEKADALTQVGLPDPAVLEVQQKPAVEDVPVLEEQAPASDASDVPEARGSNSFAEVVELVDTLP